MASIGAINLKVLNFNNNISFLNESEFITLLDSLYNTEINTINFAPGSIQSSKFRVFCEHNFIKGNIKSLYLSGNYLTDEDMKFVTTLHNLRYLDLSNNFITKDCIINGRMLSMFNEMAILDLKNNPLDSNEVFEIRDIVQVTGLSDGVLVFL